MKCNSAQIGDVASFRKVSIKPDAGTIYHCYSLPAFDNARKPEILDGSEILSNKLHIENGDILVNKLNMRFKRIWPINSLQANSVCSTEFVPLCPNEKVDRNYLLYILMSDDFANALSGMRTGTSGSHQRVKPEWILDYKFPLPSIEKQRRIGSFLSSLDQKIAINTKLNGYLEELLLAQFTALSPNENWTEGRADSYYEIGIGKTPPRKEPEWFSDVKADNHVWLSIKDMGEAGTYSLDSSEYLTDAAVNGKNVRRVPAGSVLLSFKLTVGRVKIAGCNMTTNEAIACFASDDKRKLAYAYPYLRSFDYGKLGSTSSIATAVNSKTVKAMPFAMPDDLELSEFYLSTKPIYEQLLATAKESRFLAQLRDVLLPKLMSGEIDVSKVDLTQLNSHLA
ncbi:restriction endonuclease subunit S [Collinsella sp. AF33-16]|uniref:restriction endonuclease subunit S n=1 Tax=Collinsella sp. AF33-16 TaxID=2292012 RepID=UPI000E4AF308|nr:restriction endonuclease subunit S [Collinsella sp. AF33-16]RHM64567.1 restriction endonuclease subunit S [Collinsella sp. AF33-16]